MCINNKNEKMKKILIIAPHADDEVLGCGGIMHKYAQAGHDVNVLIATNASIGAPEFYKQTGIDSIRAQAKSAHQYLGNINTFFLELPAPSLDTYPIYKSANQISALLSEIKPTDLYIPHRGDIHKDHTHIFYAALVASRPINNCSVKRIYAYETLSETEWAPPSADEAFIPNVFVNIENSISHKLEAMSFFKSQLKEFPHPRSLKAIQSLAEYRGSTVSCNAAEAFMLIREID